MRGVRAARAGAFLAVLGLVGTSGAVDVTDRDRLFRDYISDTAVVERGQLRVEIQGIVRHDEQSHPSEQIIQRGFPAGDSDRGERRDDVRLVSGGQLDLIGSYGVLPNTEVGFDFPGMFQGLRFFNATPDTSDDPKENGNDIGDMHFYGKYKYALNDQTALGGGLDLRLPTGSEQKRLGTGEVGLEPFISTNYDYGRVGVGVILGYQFNGGSLDDVFHWNTHFTVRGAQSWAFRTEFVGRHFSYGGAKIDDVVAMPGLDYNFTKTITIRPVGLAGITSAAFDWGIGVGAAMVF